jgi:hypothetical protein
VRDWEVMMVVGSVRELGEWLADNALALTRGTTDETVYVKISTRGLFDG